MEFKHQIKDYHPLPLKGCDPLYCYISQGFAFQGEVTPDGNTYLMQASKDVESSINTSTLDWGVKGDEEFGYYENHIKNDSLSFFLHVIKVLINSGNSEHALVLLFVGGVS